MLSSIASKAAICSFKVQAAEAIALATISYGKPISVGFFVVGGGALPPLAGAAPFPAGSVVVGVGATSP